MIQQTKPVGAYQDNGLHKATLTLKNSAKKRQQVLVTVHAIAEEAGQTMTLLKANLLRLCAAVNQPNYLYSTVNPNDAQAAYNAFLEFKDVVKAAQR